jgi:pyrroline-5-carboxylate reductase
VVASDVSPERRSLLKKKFGICVTDSNSVAIESSKIVIFAVKPQVIGDVLNETGRFFKQGQVIISIAAGITIRYIENHLKPGLPVVRTMPNTPLLCGAGATAVSGGKYAKKRHLELAKKIFSISGCVVDVPEGQLNAVTALSGSGPAYVFYLAELLKNAGVKMGLKEEMADRLSRQAIYGAGKMLKERANPASELRKNVTSPGGTTEAALKHLVKRNFAGIFIGAVKQAKKRADTLAK